MSRDLIYFSPIPWRGLYQRPQHTARHLARTRRVLYVEPKTLYADAPPPEEKNLHFLSLAVVPTNARNPFVRGLARIGAATPIRSLVESRQAGMLKRKLNELGLENPLLFFGHPEFYPLRRLFPTAPVVYDHMDDILRFGAPSAALQRDYTALLREADLVNATSARLADQVQAAGVRKLSRIGNGVEWKRFARADENLPEPEALLFLPRPRVLYAGSVAEWFDWELLFELARQFPQLAFPVIGPVRPALSQILNGAPDNVRFLGTRPYEEVPAWLAHCQAALIPFRMNLLTEAVDPVKIYEYLASGLPVLATPFSPEVRALDGPVALAASVEDLAVHLARILRDPPPPDGQRAAAESRRWDVLLDELVAALDEL